MNDSQEVGQVGQESRRKTRIKREAYFEVAQDENGDWEWCFWSANGRMLAISPIAYPAQDTATQAIATMKALIRDGNEKVLIRKPKNLDSRKRREQA